MILSDDELREIAERWQACVHSREATVFHASLRDIPRLLADRAELVASLRVVAYVNKQLQAERDKLLAFARKVADKQRWQWTESCIELGKINAEAAALVKELDHEKQS